MPKGQKGEKTDKLTGYDYANLQGQPHSQVSNSGFQSASSEQNSRYLQRGSNPYTDYLHPELSMRNPVGGMRGSPHAIGSYEAPDGSIRQIGGKKHIGKAFKKVGKSVEKVGKDVATGVGTQMLVNALTNPAVDEGLMEGAEVGMMAMGRRRGRPPTGGKKGLSKGLKKVGKAVIKHATPILKKQGEKLLEKGIESLVNYMVQDETSEMSGGKKMSLKDIAKHPATKKIAHEVIKQTAPIVKEHGKKMIQDMLKGSEPSGGKIHVGKALKKVGKVAEPIAVGVASNVLADAITSGAGRRDKVRQAIDDIEDLGSDIKRMARKSGGSSSGGARSIRAGIVKQVMKERGVSLPEASKIVKAEGLY